MIEALSFADQRVVFAKVFVPSDANDDTDDTVIVSSLAGYLPEDPDAPIVRVVGDRKDPKIETFIVRGAAGARHRAGSRCGYPSRTRSVERAISRVARFDVAP